MTDAELTDLVKSTLIKIAPDLENEKFAADTNFREQFEVDSMDLLNFIIALHQETGIDIPERDYSKLETLSGCVAYLKAKGYPASGAGAPSKDMTS
ncbi:acyl carrier protein [Hyphomicrobium sp. 99]|uniref:acyl carrier protein n=1 Tax=Hyphomicrobium sp. 99 TaxID=1163419 RepID=UPI0005F7AC62|nr:acyl carrier protein [Hyphomicrobium sp. 99]